MTPTTLVYALPSSKGRGFPFALLLCGILSSCSAKGALLHPNLIYSAEDRNQVLQAVAERGPSFHALNQIKSVDLAKSLAPTMNWEGGRAQSLFRLGILIWLDPAGSLKKTGESYAEAARSGIESITMPGRRAGEGFSPLPERKGGWGTYLDASGTLWNYAAAYDMLASAQGRQGGVTEDLQNALYTKVADGGFAGFVDHLRSLNVGGKGTLKNAGNNWIARELAGVGLACLSFRDRFESEPAGSKRRQDYEDGLKLVRLMSTAFLRTNTDSRERASYYYEGPHYFQYWAEMFIPFAHAHELAFPGVSKELSLAAGSPLMQLLRGQMMSGMPTRVTKAGPVWTNAPLDDSWIDANSLGTMALMAAAWGPQDERAGFLNMARRSKVTHQELLIGNPVAELSTGVPSGQLPAVEVAPYTGLAVLRTGSTDHDLSVVLKNSRTLFANDKKTGDFGPHLFAHTHSDTGEVVAFRDAEPILMDPGYGPGGYGSAKRTLYFSNWNRHNVLMVEGAQGYGSGLKSVIEEAENFVLPAHTAEPSGPRILLANPVSDRQDTLSYATAQTASSKRSVILVDRDTILVVDRLPAAARVKLAWWGNGAKRFGPMTVEASGAAKEDSIASVIGNASPSSPTAFIDTSSGVARYTRGNTSNTQISVYLPSPKRVVEVDGRYGPFWNPTEIPLTGMHVSSDRPVKFAVTLIEVQAKGGQFHLSALPKESANGDLESVTITGGSAAITYVVRADGSVTSTK